MIAKTVRAFKANPNITIVGIESANGQIDEAYNVTHKLLMTYPDIKLIFASNDVMALGVIRALSDTTKTDVLVDAFDNLVDARNAIKQGRWR